MTNIALNISAIIIFGIGFVVCVAIIIKCIKEIRALLKDLK